MVIKKGLILADRYRLRSQIAMGGMGELWYADDIKLNREVAIKILKEDHIDNELFLERLKIEAKNNSMLSHPNIVFLYDYNDDKEKYGVVFLVMEYLHGLALSVIIANQDLVDDDTDEQGSIAGDKGAFENKFANNSEKPGETYSPRPNKNNNLNLTKDQKILKLDEKTVLKILLQVAEALDYMHNRGIVHRDIKSGNIIVDKNCHVKLSDFGVSRSSTQKALTEFGMVVGTAQYISPEQALGKGATNLSDIYSLGVVGYEMITGKRPYGGATPVDIAAAHVQNPIPEIVERKYPFSTETKRLIEQMLSKRPELRPQNSRELVDRIHKILADKFGSDSLRDSLDTIDTFGPQYIEPAVEYDNQFGKKPLTTVKHKLNGIRSKLNSSDYKTDSSDYKTESATDGEKDLPDTGDDEKTSGNKNYGESMGLGVADDTGASVRSEHTILTGSVIEKDAFGNTSVSEKKQGAGKKHAGLHGAENKNAETNEYKNIYKRSYNATKPSVSKVNYRSGQSEDAGRKNYGGAVYYRNSGRSHVKTRPSTKRPSRHANTLHRKKRQQRTVQLVVRLVFYLLLLVLLIWIGSLIVGAVQYALFRSFVLIPGFVAGRDKLLSRFGNGTEFDKFG